MKGTDRRIDPNTTAWRERAVVASLLDSPGAQPGPNLCTAIAYAPDYWEDPNAGQIAGAIRQCAMNARPCTPVSVSEYLSPSVRPWLFHKEYSVNALPLALAEVEAADLVRRYFGKRLLGLLGKAFNQVKAHPENAKVVAQELKTSLEEFA